MPAELAVIITAKITLIGMTSNKIRQRVGAIVLRFASWILDSEIEFKVK